MTETVSSNCLTDSLRESGGLVPRLQAIPSL